MLKCYNVFTTSVKNDCFHLGYTVWPVVVHTETDVCLYHGGSTSDSMFVWQDIFPKSTCGSFF